MTRKSQFKKILLSKRNVYTTPPPWTLTATSLHKPEFKSESDKCSSHNKWQCIWKTTRFWIVRYKMFVEEESRRYEGEECAVEVVPVIETINFPIHVIVKVSRWYKDMFGC